MARDVNGLHYLKFLENLHDKLRPQTYFEIGTLNGATLAIANCAAIAVDPSFALTGEVVGKKPACMLFQEPSDAFFARKNPVELFGRPIDLAFLDGMHLLEFLLRDFINTEKQCRRNSIVALHDCLPPDIQMTTRDMNDPRRQESAFPGYWTGDVWKIVGVLKKFRPDLDVTITDAHGTGLVLITNLDPESAVLAQSYQAITREFSTQELDEAAFEDYWTSVVITPTQDLMTLEQLSARFWF